MSKKIVILTPTKNEQWIIRQFLTACSQFAHHIILCDQLSTDETLSIAAGFPKVHIIKNENPNFNEKERAELLVKTARSLYGTDCILIALDADEIIPHIPAGEGIWEQISSLAEGYSIRFTKPDVTRNGNLLINPGHWSLGFVDDGRSFIAEEIHTGRVPQSDELVFLVPEKLPVLHFVGTRPLLGVIKRSYYCLLERVNGWSNIVQRTRFYSSRLETRSEIDPNEISPAIIPYLNKIGLTPTDVYDGRPIWQEIEVLKLFDKHGSRYFCFEPIWDLNWEEARRYYLSLGVPSIPSKPIPNYAIFAKILKTCVVLGLKSVNAIKNYKLKKREGRAC